MLHAEGPTNPEIIAGKIALGAAIEAADSATWTDKHHLAVYRDPSTAGISLLLADFVAKVSCNRWMSFSRFSRGDRL